MTKHREDLHFMKKIIILITVFSLFLGACNTDNSTDYKNDKAENPTKKDKNNKASNKDESMTKNKDDKHTQTTLEKKIDVKDLSDKTRIALAFFADKKGEYLITKEEILSGKYYAEPPFNKIEKLENISIRKSELVFKNAPQGMKFFKVEPPKGNFASIVGINDEKLFIGGTQGGIEYFDQLASHSKMYNLSEIYDQYKNNPELYAVENKIQFTNNYVGSSSY